MLSQMRTRQFQSPPSRVPRVAPNKATSEPGLEAAQSKEKKSKGKWLLTAAGLTMAAGALSGCGGQPVPPAPDPGAYQLESPEVVVLTDSIQRIDLSRETETDCTGIGEDETCTTENVAYHRVAIHFGEGIAQDLNGNLFAAPQLVAEGAPGLAVSNPDSVFVDGYLGSEGRLERTGPNTFETRYSLMGGRREITLSPNEAVVTAPGLFGGEYESMRVTNNDGVVTISEGRWDQQLVQSQGDHILVQTPHGIEIGQIRHDSQTGNYSVFKEQLFADYEIHVSYNDTTATFTDNSWGTNDTTVRRGQNGEGQETFETRHGRWHNNTVTVTQDGWSTHHPGLFGGSTIPTTISGGQTLPGQ